MPDGGEYSVRGVAAWPTGWDGGAAGGASHEGVTRLAGPCSQQGEADTGIV